MKKLLSLIITLTFILTCMVCFGLTFAATGIDGYFDGEVITGDHVVWNNQTIKDDVVVIGSDFEMDSDSKIEGDFAVFFSNAKVDGNIEGDVALTFGNLTLGPNAIIGGDLGIFKANVDIDEKAVVKGTTRTSGGDFNRRNAADHENREDGEGKPFVYDWNDSFTGSVFHFVGTVISTIFVLVSLSAVSWLVAAMLPEQMKLVGDTVVENSLLSFAVGLATMVFALVLIVLICFIFPVFIWFAVAVAILFGWISIGQIVGERLLVALDQPFPNFTTSTIAGVIVLTTISYIPELIGSLWCVGFLLSFIAVIITTILVLTGLGAVILTRFGTYPYESSYNSTWSPRPRRTQWPDPDVDIDEPSPKDEGIDLNKPTDSPPDE